MLLYIFIILIMIIYENYSWESNRERQNIVSYLQISLKSLHVIDMGFSITWRIMLIKHIAGEIPNYF